MCLILDSIWANEDLKVENFYLKQSLGTHVGKQMISSSLAGWQLFQYQVHRVPQEKVAGEKTLFQEQTDPGAQQINGISCWCQWKRNLILGISPA